MFLFIELGHHIPNNTLQNDIDNHVGLYVRRMLSYVQGWRWQGFEASNMVFLKA